jgi:hypothetical protein
VRDSSGGALPGITVLVTNEATSASNEVVTNERGAFEIPYLLPGTYQIVAQAQGFKKFTQNGLVLTVNSRVELPVTLEVGVITDEVTVTAEAPLLETTSSASATLTNRQVNVLPIFGNSALLLARSVPGMQWTGQPNYLGLHSNAGASAVNAAGGVGGTEFSLDGVPNAGPNRRVGYLPYTDTIDEIKIETAGFDASKGHSSDANISMLTKSGTNQFRGSTTWQYWNQDWNATQSTTNGAYYAARRSGVTSCCGCTRTWPPAMGCATCDSLPGDRDITTWNCRFSSDCRGGSSSPSATRARGMSDATCTRTNSTRCRPGG